MNIRKNAPTMPYSLLLVAGWESPTLKNCFALGLRAQKQQEMLVAQAFLALCNLIYEGLAVGRAVSMAPYRKAAHRYNMSRCGDMSLDEVEKVVI
jgi:hypothetical protein